MMNFRRLASTSLRGPITARHSGTATAIAAARLRARVAENFGANKAINPDFERDLGFPEPEEQTLNIRPSQAMPLVMSQEEARQLVHDPSVRFIDVRSEGCYENGHIPNAASIQELASYKASSDSAGINQLKTKFGKIFREAGINNDTHIVLYDVAWAKQRGAATRGWYLLNVLGHTNISILDGGWEAWAKNQESPKDDEVDLQFEAGNFTPTWRPDLWADKQDVVDVITGKKKAVILDVRDQDDRKEIPAYCPPPTSRPSSLFGARPASRHGEIPTSVKVAWKQLINVDPSGKQGSTLKTGEEVSRLLGEAGISREDEIIVMCFKGTRASSALFQLKRAGFINARSYFASWNEWSKDLLNAY